MDKKVLIFGNLGYVGKALESTLNKEYEIHGFDNNYFNNTIFGKLKLKKQIFGDVRKIKKFNFKNYYAIIYLAAISNDPIGEKYKKSTFEINTDAAYEIAKNAKKAGVKKFIYASSCSVYGKSHDKIQNEKSKCNPLTNYAKSKFKAEKKLKDIANNKFKIFCFRFPTACGYSNNFRNDLVLNDFAISAKKNSKIILKSDGKAYRPFIHVMDMAKVIKWSLKKNINNYVILNVGQKKLNLKIIDCAKIINSIFPNSKIVINSKNPTDKRSYTVDFSLCEKLLGKNFFKYKTIKKIGKDLKNNSKKIRLNNLSIYYRLKRLNSLQKECKINNNLNWI